MYCNILEKNVKKYNYVPQIELKDCDIKALSRIIQHYSSSLWGL